MIPIMDKRGKVIAFGGRIMGDGQPKYLNSPETPVFNKRRVLYNLNHARDAAFQEKRLIICEGYMDVIGMDNYGIHYAVAPLGTALTEDQIQEAWKVVDEPTCCFDGDMAGKRAAIRSVDRVLPILKAGNSLKYVFLTGAKDPDEFLKAFGRDEFLKVISNTVPLKDLLWQKNTEDKPVSTPEQKALVEKNIKEEVAKIADETVRNYYAQDMQNKIYYELGKGSWRKRADAGYEERRSCHNSGYRRSDYRSAAPTVSLVGTIKTNLDDLMAQYVVSALYCYPELLEEYEERLYNFEFKNARLRAILDMMLEAVREDESLADAEKMAAYLEEKGMGKDVKELLECKMMRRQNPDVIKMRAHLDARIVEEQLCQLDLEIKECLRQIESCESFPEDVFGRYQSLKKEREAILAAQDSD